MNLLIIGGLLALAIVAILGAVLLGIGEERAMKKSGEVSAALPVQALPTPQVPETPQVSNTVPLPTPPVESEMSKPLAPSQPLQAQASSIPQVPGVSQTPEITLPSLPSEERQMTGPSAPPLHESGLLSAYRNSQMPEHREEEYTMIPNSQVHKFADELRFLAQQTSELEQHLTSLRKALEDLQDEQSEVTTQHHALKLDKPSF